MARLTDWQIDCLLYGETEIEAEGFRLTAWMDYGKAEKHIDIFIIGTDTCHSFIVNGMDRERFRRKVESLV